MTSEGTPVSAQRRPQLDGQTVVVIGGSAGIGLETGRRARAEGADVVLTGRNPERLQQAAADVGAQRTAAFDASDTAALRKFFQDLPTPIDHVMVTAGGPRYGPILEMDEAQVRQAVSERVVLALEVARHSAAKIRPPGTLLFIGGTGARRVRPGLGIVAATTAMLPPFTAALALELAPVRVNLIAAGFVDTPLSASLLGDRLEERRNELRATLPIGRVVGPADVAALAVHIMTNTALTGATYDIDGGQQFVSLRTRTETDMSWPHEVPLRLRAAASPMRLTRAFPIDPPVAGGTSVVSAGRSGLPQPEERPVMPVATELSGVVAEHIAAVNACDLDRIVATFAPDAYVNDNRREIWGTAAIRAFMAKEFVGDSVTMKVIEALDHHGDIIVRARYDGTYDKTNLPAELVMTSYFGVRDDKIISLAVIFNQPSPY